VKETGKFSRKDAKAQSGENAEERSSSFFISLAPLRLGARFSVASISPRCRPWSSVSPMTKNGLMDCLADCIAEAYSVKKGVNTRDLLSLTFPY